MQSVSAAASAGTIIPLATDGPNNHPPEKWAKATTMQIVNAPPDHPYRRMVCDVLTDFHGRIQRREREKLAEFGAERLKHPFATAETIDDRNAAASQISGLAAAAGGLIALHFNDPDKREHLLRTIFKDFATSMNIERLLFLDRKNRSA